MTSDRRCLGVLAANVLAAHLIGLSCRYYRSIVATVATCTLSGLPALIWQPSLPRKPDIGPIFTSVSLLDLAG